MATATMYNGNLWPIQAALIAACRWATEVFKAAATVRMHNAAAYGRCRWASAAVRIYIEAYDQF